MSQLTQAEHSSRSGRQADRGREPGKLRRVRRLLRLQRCRRRLGRQFQGPVAIRGWSDQEFIGVDVSLTVLDTTINGFTVTVTAQVGGNGFTGPSHFTFTVRGDRIARMAITA